MKEPLIKCRHCGFTSVRGRACRVCIVLLKAGGDAGR